MAPPARLRRRSAGPPIQDATTPDANRRIVGAVSAYRGYRRQALYALCRLLLLREDERLQPEGVEDLSIVADGALVEALQVKSYGADLTLSHLEPERPGSFLRAAAERTTRGGRERLRLISFGPLGPELTGVRDGNRESVESVIRKLTGMGIEHSTAANVLGRLEVEEIHEEAVSTAVMERLRALLTGVDPDAAFGLLTFWMYVQSERRQTITVADARDRIQAVGRYLAAAHARHEEWFVTIVPIEDVAVLPERRSLLEAEFYQGVSVRYEHVAAGLAVERGGLLQAIDRGFDAERVVVVHAASGQGKTTLAYQYLSLLPASWRFRITAVPDRFHALQMAAALEGHATAVGLPVYVHLDVAPRDTEWPTLARELSTNEHIRLLITIREEDWRRSTDLAVIGFSEIDPSLSQGEAMALFAQLQPRFPNAPPTFEEAWTRFGSRGPLLEFVYLVTQRDELRDRLAEQVTRLRIEARTEGTSTVDFLRLAAVVSAYEARAELRPLAELAGLPDPAFAVARLEREYLLRVSEDGRLVSGLHPIRSTILADLLTDPVAAPLSDQLVAAVPVVAEEDLESFMLGALSTPEVAANELLAAALRRPLATWAGFAGIGRAFRWRGVADYAEGHRLLIEEVDPGHSGRWMVTLETDLAGAMPGGGTRQIWERLAGSLPSAVGARDAALRFQERQAPVGEAFAPMREWLERASHPPVPATPSDWSAFAEMRYFSRRLGLMLEPQWLDAEALDTALETASLDALADLSLSLAEDVVGTPPDDLGRAWLDRHRAALLDRYRRGVSAVATADDGETIGIDFVIGIRPDEGSGAETPSRDYNAESVVRLELLRRLIPDRDHYAAQGWGHRVPGLAFDGTQKRIPRQSLPPLWLVSVNAMFRGYVERWWRPAGWSHYREGLSDSRRETASRLEVLSTSLERFLRGAGASPLEGTTTEAWFEAWRTQLDAPALLPTDAVDRFGFVDESSLLAEQGRAGVERRGLAIQPYLALIKARRELTRELSNFTNSAPGALVVAAALGRANASQRQAILDKAEELGIANNARLSVHNLGSAVKSLAPFHAAIREVLSEGVAGLNERERRALRRVFDLWQTLTDRPWQRFGEPSVQIAREHQRFIANWQRQIVERLHEVARDFEWRVGDHDGPDGGLLVISGSGPDAVAVYGSLEDAVGVVHEALAGLGQSQLAIIETSMPRILVIPLVYEWSLAGDAISLSTLVMSASDWTPDWWHFVPRPMPPELASRYPALTSSQMADANRLAGAFANLLGGLTHLLDLPSREGLDALGREVLDGHAAPVLATLRDLAIDALHDLDRLMEALRRIDAGLPYVQDLPTVLESLRLALESAPFRVGLAAPTRGELEAWRPVLEADIQRMTIARLAWATIVVSPTT